MILIYRVLTTFIYPILIILIYYRKIINKEDSTRFKEKIFVSNFRPVNKNKSKLIWFHAASIGELKSIIPIISQLNKNKKFNFLITTTTLSSGNLAKIELRKLKNTEHRYLPLDINFLMDKFLYLWKPDKIFLVDSEIWPNLLLNVKKYNIPIAIINARLTQKSRKKWLLFPNTAKKIFNIFHLFICSNIETRNYLKKLRLQNIFFKGNIKLINQIKKEKIINENKKFLIKKRFWFAASIHKEENIFCIKTHLKLKEIYKDVITILAPRHIERTNEIIALSKRYNLSTQVLERNKKILNDREIIIINHFGVLNNFFKYAKSVFIGKSMIENLKNEGGQNPIDAAKLECKIYHGPYVYNFEDIYKILNKNGISLMINNYNELSKNLISDLKNSTKKNKKNSTLMNKLGKKTFSDTMIIINNFLNNKYE